MKPKLYIDGQEGTTGLQIYDRLTPRQDIELLLIDEEKRKDPAERKKCLNAADLVFLCLPDAAAVEAVSLIENGNTKVIDASTAHRTAPGWAYGFAELSKLHRAQICESMRVSNPGCHATGFISIVYPLVGMGILPADTPLSCFSLTGYSGGGKKMIAQYEAEGREDLLSSPAIYGITQSHKHLPEMVGITGLEAAPIFCPIVADYYCGMVVTVPLFRKQLNAGFGIADVKDCYRAKYAGPIVSYTETMDEGGFINSNALAGKDTMEVAVFGNEERMLLVSRFDNLGKGASGAAVQCINLMLGADECAGLVL